MKLHPATNDVAKITNKSQNTMMTLIFIMKRFKKHR